MAKIVYRFGINDADYSIKPTVNGKARLCRIFQTWRSMVERCYIDHYKEKHPTYIGCTVCEEWMTFSIFKSWMEKQDWKDKQLDKDIIKAGNKVYSPDLCCFVSPATNTFITDCGSARGDFLIGVNVCNKTGKFEARCRNPFTGKKEYIGRFKGEVSAHSAWKKRKHELALVLSSMQSDERAAAGLKTRYL